MGGREAFLRYCTVAGDEVATTWEQARADLITEERSVRVPPTWQAGIYPRETTFRGASLSTPRARACLVVGDNLRMTEIPIRRGGVADIDVCVRLWTHTRAARDGVYEEGVPERTRAKFEQSVLTLIAETGGCVQGFALVSAPGTGHPSDPKNAAVLRLLAVAPATQGYGLGRQLLRAVAHELGAARFTKAVLHVLNTNLPAIRLYESEGWECTGELDGAQDGRHFASYTLTLNRGASFCDED